MAVNQAVTSLRGNVVVEDRPPLINISEKELIRKERTTLAQLRSRHLFTPDPALANTRPQP